MIAVALDIAMAERRFPKKQAPAPPKRDVLEKTDPKHSEADFLQDLGKATSSKARKKLGLPGSRG
jgi:hypothetical protein